MNEIQDLAISTNFWYFKNLPLEVHGIIETFSFYEENEKFKICKKAASQYFYFIRYCILYLISLTGNVNTYNNF